MSVFSSYIKRYITILVLGLLLITSFNFIVDPERLFEVVDIKGFNHEKPFRSSTGLRRVMSIEMQQENYNALILGTSRIGAINTKHSIFDSKSVYKAAIIGTNMYEIYKIFSFANNHKKIDTIILGLDFLAFTNKRTVNADFNNSLFAGENIFKIYLNSLLSIRQLSNSVKTISYNTNNKNKIKQKKNISHRILFDNILTQNFLFNEQTYGGYSYSKERIDLFRQIVKNCQKNNIDLYLFISPIHARQLEAIKVLGLFPIFEQWKRDLVDVLDKNTTANPNQEPFYLWDFTGYNSVTTEDIPSYESKDQMQWYTESSHYKPETGDMIIELMFRYPKRNKNIPIDFGRLINKDNIELHLKTIRIKQSLYEKNYPQEVKEVERLAQVTK